MRSAPTDAHVHTGRAHGFVLVYESNVSSSITSCFLWSVLAKVPCNTGPRFLHAAPVRPERVAPVAFFRRTLRGPCFVRASIAVYQCRCQGRSLGQRHCIASASSPQLRSSLSTHYEHPASSETVADVPLLLCSTRMHSRRHSTLVSNCLCRLLVVLIPNNANDPFQPASVVLLCTLAATSAAGR